MKVIGAGFGRTGTASLKVALADLGLGPCYHMKEVIANPRHARFWLAALNGEAVNWKEFFASYQSTVDWPACHFYRQLMAEYPDAKVLLSVRDPESWYKSCRNTIFKISHSVPVSIIRKLLPWMPFAAPGKVANRMIWEQTFANRFTDKTFALEVFNRHIEEVKQYVKPERLLVYDVKQGWEPLCSFLGVPVPDKPFPRLNDTQEFQRNIKRAEIMSSAILGLGAVGIAALIRRLSRR